VSGSSLRLAVLLLAVLAVSFLGGYVAMMRFIP
jgi:nitrate reductase NapE component